MKAPFFRHTRAALGGRPRIVASVRELHSGIASFFRLPQWFCLLLLIALCLPLADALATHSIAWRLKIREAAVVAGEQVLLGEIAQPVGDMDPALWEKLAETPLWASPPQGRPMNMTRPRVQQAMAAYAKELSGLCQYPGSLTIQRGGTMLDQDQLRAIVVKSLTPRLGLLPGEADLDDFRLPPYAFLAEASQWVELEGPANLYPGRNSLRFVVKDVGDVPVRRFTGTVFVNCWAMVPCAAVSMNKDDVILPEQVTFARKNLAHLRDAPWDGKGGPWRLGRAVTLGQPILQADINVVPAVRKGAQVNIVYQKGGVRLSATGEALADGVVGESIPVRNLQSKRQTQAIVRDPLTVVVQ